MPTDPTPSPEQAGAAGAPKPLCPKCGYSGGSLKSERIETVGGGLPAPLATTTLTEPYFLLALSCPECGHVVGFVNDLWDVMTRVHALKRELDEVKALLPPRR
jgi:hypothetical protein